jgi:hypothetical protein
MGGHRRPILAPYRDFILARLRERPETTLLEMREFILAEHGVSVNGGGKTSHLAAQQSTTVRDRERRSVRETRLGTRALRIVGVCQGALA